MSPSTEIPGLASQGSSQMQSCVFASTLGRNELCHEAASSARLFMYLTYKVDIHIQTFPQQYWTRVHFLSCPQNVKTKIINKKTNKNKTTVPNLTKDLCQESSNSA